ncbi:hypothetical protein B0A48_15585 [Cryoendolithus antarcticus]|uniref:Uncharacterized protein n=1 Tax=Cryoendolithus antarcticus TaxID=1507870 RepID=A0A1V8SGP9_9PEZI|nr:hypothetical protein B0A48_15585 [Cryoendolithus antarcticus]
MTAYDTATQALGITPSRSDRGYSGGISGRHSAQLTAVDSAASADSTGEVMQTTSAPAPEHNLDEHHAELDAILSEMAIEQLSMSWLELAQQLRFDLTRQFSRGVDSGAVLHPKASQYLEILERLIKLLDTYMVDCVANIVAARRYIPHSALASRYEEFVEPC